MSAQNYQQDNPNLQYRGEARPPDTNSLLWVPGYAQTYVPILHEVHASMPRSIAPNVPED